MSHQKPPSLSTALGNKNSLQTQEAKAGHLGLKLCTCSLHPAGLSRELPTVLLHAAPCFKLPTLYRGSAAEGPGRLDMRITCRVLPATPAHVQALTRCTQHTHSLSKAIKGYWASTGTSSMSLCLSATVAAALRPTGFERAAQEKCH